MPCIENLWCEIVLNLPVQFHYQKNTLCTSTLVKVYVLCVCVCYFRDLVCSRDFILHSFILSIMLSCFGAARGKAKHIRLFNEHQAALLFPFSLCLNRHFILYILYWIDKLLLSTLHYFLVEKRRFT